MAKVLATPADGLRVRRPDGVLLNPAGELVDRSAFWLRRERDGDVTLAPAPEAEPAEGDAAAKSTTTRKGA